MHLDPREARVLEHVEYFVACVPSAGVGGTIVGALRVSTKVYIEGGLGTFAEDIISKLPTGRGSLSIFRWTLYSPSDGKFGNISVK